MSLATAEPELTGVRARFAAVVASHPVVDAYAGYVPPLIGVLQVRCDLTPLQAASLLSIGPLTSGLSQPVFAWLTDHVDSRIFGAIGLAVAAACLSAIGLADDFATLVVIFSLGMLGVGAYHPVAAASVGQISGSRRSVGVTVFFVAGMVGATLGPLISTRITALGPNGFDLLRWTAVPGLVFAAVLHLATRKVPHRAHDHHTMRFDSADAGRRWRNVLVLLAGNGLRYSVNIALLYVYVRWAEAAFRNGAGVDPVAQAQKAALYAGELNAVTMFGMGVGGLLAGLLVRPRFERLACIVLPLALAPAIAIFPLAPRFGTYLLAIAGGIGFASVIPVSISIAQRMLPHRTSLASSLTMGGAWTMALFAPPLSEKLLAARGFGVTFGVIAALLALSGVLGLALDGGVLERTAGGGRP